MHITLVGQSMESAHLPSQNECSWHFLSKQACFAFSGGKIQSTRLEQPVSWLMEDHSLLSLNQMLVHRARFNSGIYSSVQWTPELLPSWARMMVYNNPTKTTRLLWETIVFSFENIYGRMISTSKMSSLKQNPDRCLNLVASANTICASKSTHCK